MWNRPQNTFIILSQSWINLLAFCHNIVWKDLGHLDILQNIILFISLYQRYYFNPGKWQDVATTFEALIEHICSRQWKKNSMKIQVLPHPCSFFIGSWCMAGFSLWKLLPLSCPTTIKGAQYLDFFRNWRQHIPHVGIHLWSFTEQ